VNCVATPGWVEALPRARTGWNGCNNEVEGTKIIPDGLLTAGAHVQYFFRRGSTITGAEVGTAPDTNIVFPQNTEGNTDAHRWQECSVLPNRWNDAVYIQPGLGDVGLGQACLLVVDNNDRRGNERVWVSVADTLGMTSAAKRGSHNGWRAPGGDPDVTMNDPANFVRRNGGSPGTTWDMFQVKASESLTTQAGSLGSRFAFRNSLNTQIDPKSSRQGPTLQMMNSFYSMIFWMTGDINSGTLGPFSNRSQNDCRMVQQWLQSGSGTAPGNRAIWFMGDGFVEDMTAYLPTAQQPITMYNFLGVDIRNPNYILESGGNVEFDIDLIPFSPILDDTTAAEILGLRNLCTWTNDVVVHSGLLGTFDASKYEDTIGPALPMLSGIGKTFQTPSTPWISLVDGWDIEHLTSRFDSDTRGRHRYFYEVLTNVFASICGVVGTPVINLDVPNHTDGRLFNFVNLANNPMTTGSSVVLFGMARADQVSVKVYDVTGRLVRTLADRHFPAGEHKLLWDGVSDGGRRVPRGVYFTQVQYKNSKFTAAKKVTVLK
jgi:hypothetical protein